MNRRKHRRKYRKQSALNIKHSIIPVMLAICFSVAAGYLTAAYIIGPALGLESKPAVLEFLHDDSEEKQSAAEKTPKDTGTATVVEDSVSTESGYALQYGSFSAEEGAQQCVDDLKSSGIEAEIIKKDNMYKVIGPVFSSKEKARTEKEKSEATDVFITEIP